MLSTVLRMRASTYLSLFMIMLLSGCVTPSITEQNQPIVDDIGFSSFQSLCIKDSEFAIGGVRLGTTETQVISLLGTPRSVVKHPNVLDLWIEDRLVYDNFSVDVYQGKVVGQHIDGPPWKTPSGLYVGMSETELMKKFGHPVAPVSRSEGGSAYELYYCNLGQPFDLGSSFRIVVDDDQRVTDIYIATDTP